MMKHTKERIRLRHDIYGEVSCDLRTYYDATDKPLVRVELPRARDICGKRTRTLTVSRQSLAPVHYHGVSVPKAKPEEFVPNGSNVKDHGDLYRAIAYNAEAARKKAAKAGVPVADLQDVAQQVWVVAPETSSTLRLNW